MPNSFVTKPNFMANKKNKRKSCVSQKISKSKYNNELKSKMYSVVKAAKAEEAYRLIPKKEFDMLYLMGMKPIAILPSDGQDIPSFFLKQIKNLTYSFLKNEKFCFYENGPEISLYDYYLVGEPLRFLLRNLSDTTRNKDLILKGFELFMNYTNLQNEPGKAARYLADLLTMKLSAFSFGYTIFQFDFCQTKSLYPTIFNCYYVKIVFTERSKVSLNNHTREVYKVGYPVDNNVVWMTTNPSKLGIESNFADLEIDIYIQKHAIQRLYERLDCMEKFVIHLYLLESLLCFTIGNNRKGQKLIEFKSGDIKLGYLAYEYVEGVVVITTFLLLTNNGTPEGDRLQEVLGMQKLDKQYLGIDKLKNLVFSDIVENKQIYDLFRDAGCANLFEIPKDQFVKIDENKELASRLSEYLQIEADVYADATVQV